MQKFKGDDVENKYIAVGEPVFDALSAEKDAFEEGAYFSGPLGDILWTDERAPLAQTIKQDIFRDAFQEIFVQYQYAGTFESYLAIFRQIFGPQVDVMFTVPDPGKLTIVIVAQGFTIDDIIDDVGDSLIDDVSDHLVSKTKNAIDFYLAIVRQFEGDVLVNYELIDSDGDNIIFQYAKGFKTQYELEQMLFEFVPAGIFTTVTLTL